MFKNVLFKTRHFVTKCDRNITESLIVTKSVEIPPEFLLFGNADMNDREILRNSI